MNRPYSPFAGMQNESATTPAQTPATVITKNSTVRFPSHIIPSVAPVKKRYQT